jgi:hypothetical protein
VIANLIEILIYRAHVCDFCDKKFASVRQLDQHVSWHTTIPAEGTDEIEVIEDFGKGEKVEQTEHRYVHLYFWGQPNIY